MTRPAIAQRIGPGACPEAETLALYIEGRLDPSSAALLETHLLRCDDCFVVFSETPDHLRTPAQGGKKIAGRMPELSASRYLVFGGFAAAAVLMVAVFTGGAGRVSDAEVRTAVASFGSRLEHTRIDQPRLSVDDNYRRLVPRDRSAASADASQDPDGSLLAAARELEDAATRSENESVGRAALGLMHLGLGDAAQAIDVLEPLTDSGNPSALNDLAVAYLIRRGDGDSRRALEMLERAVALDSNRALLWFNLGLAAEAEGQDERAVVAWRRTLDLESGSGWREEAGEHLTKLLNR